MRQDLPNPCHITAFESLTELRAVEPNRKLNRFLSSSRRQPTREWWGLGIHTISDINRALDRGWSKGAQHMVKTTEGLELNLRVSRPRRTRTRARIGDSLDMQRVWQGDLERAWSATEMSEQMLPLKHICLAIELNGTANFSGIDFMWRGAAALALADLIAESGRMVKIMMYGVTAGAYKDGTAHAYTVKVKDYTEPLDIERLAAAACMAGTYRHAVWKVREAHPTKKVSATYGHSRYGQWNGLPGIEPENEHVIWASNLWDSRKARQWVEGEIRKLKEVDDAETSQ